ncbi:MAG: hypothetical protein V4681_02955 [Patescibacteria group bacterium]
MPFIRQFLTLMAFVISFALIASPASAEGMNGVINACKTQNMERLSVDEEGARRLSAGVTITYNGKNVPMGRNIWSSCEEIVQSSAPIVRSDAPIARPQPAAKVDPAPVVAQKAPPAVKTDPAVKVPSVAVTEPVVPTETINAYARAAHRGQHTGGTGLIRHADEMVRNTNRPSYYDPPTAPASVFMESLKGSVASTTAWLSSRNDDAHRIKAWIAEILQPLLTDTKRADKTASWMTKQQDGVQNAAAWVTSALPSLPDIKGYAKRALAWTISPLWHLAIVVVGAIIAAIGIRFILVERDYRLHPEKYEELPEPAIDPDTLWSAVELELEETGAIRPAEAQLEETEEVEGPAILAATNCNDPDSHPISRRERMLG